MTGLFRRTDRPMSGWDALTHTERGIVALVAEGLSNPQIGERLFVSRRTVSTHLYRIFKKLDVASRSELVALAFRRGFVNERRESTRNGHLTYGNDRPTIQPETDHVNAQEGKSHAVPAQISSPQAGASPRSGSRHRDLRGRRNNCDHEGRVDE